MEKPIPQRQQNHQCAQHVPRHSDQKAMADPTSSQTGRTWGQLFAAATVEKDGY